MSVRIQPVFMTILFISATLAIVVGNGFCDIYKYVDKNGVIHFTNVPTSSAGKYQVYIRESGESPKTFPSSPISGSFNDLIIKAAQRHDIAVPLLRALIRAESNFNPRAVSKKGAMGLMQLMPQTAKGLNIRDPFDPKENIMGGARYFKQLFNRFEGKLPLAIAAYNAGPETVERHKRIPPIRETQDYVRRVLKYYHADRKG